MNLGKEFEDAIKQEVIRAKEYLKKLESGEEKPIEPKVYKGDLYCPNCKKPSTNEEFNDRVVLVPQIINQTVMGRNLVSPCQHCGNVITVHDWSDFNINIKIEEIEKYN